MAFQPPAARPLYNVYSESASLRSTGTTTVSFDLPPGATLALVGINVTATAGAGSLTVSYQQQDANGEWQTLASGSAISTVTTGNFSVGATQPLAAAARLSLAVTGTSVTFQASVQAR